MYCVIKLGEHEVGKTRAIKFDEHLVWERPEERFRLPLDDVCGAPPALGTSTAASSTIAIDDHHEYGQKHQRLSASELESNHIIDTGKDILGDEAVEGAGVDRLHVASLTIEVWGKHAIGRRRDFLGRATVPAGNVQHPPGDVWLTLGEELSPAPMVEGVHRDEEERGVNSAPVASSGSPVAAVRKKSDKPWGGGLFKTLRGLQAKTSKLENDTSGNLPPTGSVHIWLGKVHRTSSDGREPGRGRVVLHVHAAAGLRKVRCSRVQSAAYFQLPWWCVHVLWIEFRQ